jgi:hypothetical protein
MEADNSNFQGDWNALCEYCGRPHIDHQKKYELPGGDFYLHRMPCERQKHAIRKKLVLQGIVLRTVLFLYKLGVYIWDKIPFKEELKLLWSLLSHLYVSVRALIYLIVKRPK